MVLGVALPKFNLARYFIKVLGRENSHCARF